MALGFKASVADLILDAFGNSVAYDGPANLYVKLHTGDPGAAATSNAAGETTRKEVTFAASSGGSMANDGAITWTNVSTSEDYTHFSLWDASSAGNFLGSGTVTANAVTAGDTFTIAISGLTVTLSVAA